VFVGINPEVFNGGCMSKMDQLIETDKIVKGLAGFAAAIIQ